MRLQKLQQPPVEAEEGAGDAVGAAVPVEEVELGVASNLLAVLWLREDEESEVERGVRSLVRLLAPPDRELSEDVEYTVLMSLSLGENVRKKIKPSSFQDLLEIVSFLVLNKTSDTSLVKDYCEWFDKMKIVIGEMSIVDNVYVDAMFYG